MRSPRSPSASVSGSDRQVSWRAVVPAFVATTTGMMPGLLTAGLAVQIRDDIGLSLSGLGILIGSFFGVAAIVSPALGRFTERYGWVAGLRIATVLTAISLGGVGWLADSTAGIAVFFIVGGIASSLGQIASNLAIARCVSPQRQGLVFGLRHSAIPTAAFLAGLAVPTIGLTVGWRWAFRGATVLALIATASVPSAEGPQTVNPAPARQPGDVREPATPMALLVLLAVAVGLGTGAGDTIAAFIVSYSVAAGFSETSAGILLAAGSICGVGARLTAGWLIDRSSDADLTSVAGMIGTGAAAVVLLNYGGDFGLIVGGLVGFAAGWGWAGLFTYAVVKDNPEAPAAASGITQTGKYIGAAVGAPIFGAIADGVSFTAAWWFTTIALLAASGLIMYVRSRRPR